MGHENAYGLDDGAMVAIIIAIIVIIVIIAIVIFFSSRNNRNPPTPLGGDGFVEARNRDKSVSSKKTLANESTKDIHDSKFKELQDNGEMKKDSIAINTYSVDFDTDDEDEQKTDSGRRENTASGKSVSFDDNVKIVSAKDVKTVSGMSDNRQNSQGENVPTLPRDLNRRNRK